MATSAEDWCPWLSEALRAEQEHLAERLSLVVQTQLEDHRRKLLAAISSRIDAGERASRGAEGAAAAGPEEETPFSVEPTPSSVRGLKRNTSEHERKEHSGGSSGMGNGDALEPLRLNPLQTLLSWIRRLKGLPTTPEESKAHIMHLPPWLCNHDPIHLEDRDHASLHLLRQKITQTAKRISSSPHHTFALDKGSMTSMIEARHDDPKGAFSLFVLSNTFEYLSGLMIVSCLIIMILEVDYSGFDSGHNLNVTGFDEPAKDRFPNTRSRLDILNVLITAIFCIEFAARLVALRLECLWSPWMWFDALCLLLSLLDSFGSYFEGIVEPVFFRVARFARLARMLKALRAMQSLQTLYLLMRSLQASLGALFWSFALLWVAQVVTGVLLAQLLRHFIDDEDEDPAIRREVFSYFGNFMNATLTMFEITLANWVVSCRLLYVHVGWGYGLFFILYRGCFMFAVMRVITAVFLAETARCASNDDALNIQKKQRQKEVYCKKLHAVFMELDTSQDGHLSRAELMPLICDELLKTWLSTLEIDTQDIDYLVEMLDAGGYDINLEAFTSGMARVRGPARSVDLLKLQNKTSDLARKLDDLITDVRALGHMRAVPAPPAPGPPAGMSSGEPRAGVMAMHEEAVMNTSTAGVPEVPLEQAAESASAKGVPVGQRSFGI